MSNDQEDELLRVAEDGDEYIDLSGYSEIPPGAVEGYVPTPEATNEALAKMLESARPDVPTIDDPPSGVVELLWGVERDGHRYRTAIVRELNGSDEEALSRLSGNAANYNVMVVDLHLRCAVVQIGSIDIEKDQMVLGELLVSDRDILFSEILLATYGDTKDYENVPCPTCKFEMDLHIDVRGLIEITNQRAYDSDQFVVELRNGDQVLMRYANGNDQMTIFTARDRTLSAAEANTKFMAACVVKLNGKPVADPDKWALGLGITDRRKIVDALLDIPALGFKEVEVPCERCGAKLPTGFSWADLLPR